MARGLRLREVGDQVGYERGPAGLMTCSDTRSEVPMKIFMEGNQIPPVRVILEEFISGKHRAMTLYIPLENAD